jgi:predicted RNA-binding protein with TRAM domain
MPYLLRIKRVRKNPSGILSYLLKSNKLKGGWIMERGKKRRPASSGFRPARRVPVVVGGEYDVEIESLGSRGDGIARIEGFVIFVKNTKVGDKLKVRVDSISRRFAIATPVAQGGE